jgi:hypothetical protein
MGWGRWILAFIGGAIGAKAIGWLLPVVAASSSESDAARAAGVAGFLAALGFVVGVVAVMALFKLGKVLMRRDLGGDGK